MFHTNLIALSYLVFGGGVGGEYTYLDLRGGVETTMSSSELSRISWCLFRSFDFFVSSSLAKTSSSYNGKNNITLPHYVTLGRRVLRVLNTKPNLRDLTSEWIMKTFCSSKFPVCGCNPMMLPFYTRTVWKKCFFFSALNLTRLRNSSFKDRRTRLHPWDARRLFAHPYMFVEEEYQENRQLTFCKIFKSSSLLLHTLWRLFKYSSYSRIWNVIKQAH